MKIPQYKTKLSMMIIFASIILIILSMASVYYFHTGDEASVGIFSLAVTLIGTIFIAVELKNGQDVTCSEMLINLNNYFHDSDRLMKVYQVLEDCEMARYSMGGNAGEMSAQYEKAISVISNLEGEL